MSKRRLKLAEKRPRRNLESWREAMNARFRKRSKGTPVGTIPLLAVLLAASLLADLFPQTALAQGEKDALFLRLLSRDTYTEITAGESKVLLLEVENIGNNVLQEIELSALSPEGWRVDLEPARITSLSPAESTVVQVSIQTSPKSEVERHEIILRADSATVHRAISAWVTIEPPEGRWLWVGGILAAVVVAGFVVIFMRFGRD
jgi:uncharacterized membrane protein